VIKQHSKLFPSTIQQEYQLHDTRSVPPSKKMPEIRLRRITVKTIDHREEVFSVAPSFVMPYMTGYTDEIKKSLREASDGLAFATGA
jgi:hypothetical protein